MLSLRCLDMYVFVRPSWALLSLNCYTTVTLFDVFAHAAFHLTSTHQKAVKP